MVQKFVTNIAPRLARALVLLLAVCGLTGCIRYDVGITFNHEQQGQISQQIELSDRIVNFSRAVALEWLDQIEAQANQLGGSSVRLSERAIQVTIPFRDRSDLVDKFNQLLNSETRSTEASGAPTTLADLQGSLHVTEQNFIVAARHHLALDLDLGNLGLTTTAAEPGIDPTNALNLSFQLQASGGVKPVIGASQRITTPSIQAQTWQHVAWRLRPGRQNRLEAYLWVPNPIGIGGIGILVLLSIGVRLKQRSNSAPVPSSLAASD
ncbi:MAG: DUF3153 domain-containing protein [Cyanobacteria bacterium P01_H01_bin.121]